MTFKHTAAALLTAALAWAALPARPAPAAEPASFDDGWLFHRGDAPGSDAPAAADADWRKLNVPHDWMIEGVPGADPKLMDGPFDPKSPGGAGNGYLDGGVGWYRKHFPSPPAGRHVELQFDGVYMDAHCWLNGHDLGTHPYGYTSFAYDLTPHLNPTGDNVIAVRCEVKQPCSRFYSGAGIYRHVWLTTAGPVHVGHWGTYVTSTVNPDGSAAITVNTTVDNTGNAPAAVKVDAVIVAPDGTEAATLKNTVLDIGPRTSVPIPVTLPVAKPALWSTTTPAIYHLHTTVNVDGKPVDTKVTPFGIRTVQFTADRGLLLNGRHVPIRGVCDHHDLGVLGAAVNTRAIERQLQILRSMGVNAIRTSHYPPAPELLDLCDTMGFLVMDEAFDEWKQSKTEFGYGRFFDAWHERDLVSMTHRDRNHPSVILWSIGNEIPEQHGNGGDGAKLAKQLADIVRREDPTRPITSGMNDPGHAQASGFAAAVDVFGVNYNMAAYDDPKLHGHRPMLGSETSSTVSTRGAYGLALAKDGTVEIRKQFDHQVTGYDLYVPGWASHVERTLIALRDRPWMAGEFVWTGFDYLGEPTPYQWPSRSSYFGIVDLCGFPKDRFYIYQSQWTATPVVHLLPHWNWPQFAGKAIPVWCYTNADAVELFLNGKSVGKRTKADLHDLHLEWSVPYAPGELKAVGTKDGKPFATDVVVTAGPPAKLAMAVDHATLRADGRDMAFVTVTVTDAQGHVCPDAGNGVDYTLTGPATIAGLGDGDATNHEPFQGQRHRVFHGMGLVVLQSAATPGEVQLKAVAGGLQPTTATLKIGP